MKSGRKFNYNYEVYKLYKKCPLPIRLYAFLRLRLAPLQEVEKYVPHEGEIVDIGCGYGVFSNLLYITSKNRSILGVDISSERVQIAQETVQDIDRLRFVNLDALDLSLDAVKIVTMVDLLHHLPYEKQESLLGRIFDNLEEKGVLIIKDIEKSPYWKYVFHYLQDAISYRTMNLFFRSRDEMYKLLLKIGFSIEMIRPNSWLPHPHIIYCCEKGMAREKLCEHLP